MGNLKRAFVLGCVILQCVYVCTALKNLRIKVPTAVIRGHDAVLHCYFDLEGDKLYSVKWYRSGWEFYRYSPSEIPPMKQFNVVKGLKVKLKESRDTKVVLANVSKDISGTFSCEVTADQPSFFTDLKTAHLEVVDLPKKDPIISGLKTRYRLEDTIKANCTSEGSNPAANLTWRVNGIPVDEQNVQKHTPRNYLDGQYVSAQSTIRLKVTKDLFNKSKMKIRCSASMFDLYHRSSEKSVELEKRRHNRLHSHHYRYNNFTPPSTIHLFEEWRFGETERPPEAAVEFLSPVSSFVGPSNGLSATVFVSVLIGGLLVR